MSDMGLDAYLQEFESERFNPIGRVKDRGNGAALLMFVPRPGTNSA